MQFSSPENPPGGARALTDHIPLGYLLSIFGRQESGSRHGPTLRNLGKGSGHFQVIGHRWGCGPAGRSAGGCTPSSAHHLKARQTTRAQWFDLSHDGNLNFYASYSKWRHGAQPLRILSGPPALPACTADRVSNDDTRSLSLPRLHWTRRMWTESEGEVDRMLSQSEAFRPILRSLHQAQKSQHDRGSNN